MTNNWKCIYTTNQLYEAELMKQYLQDNSVVAFVLNKMDSAYKFGNVEVCVGHNDVIRAKHLVTKSGLNKKEL